MLFPKTRRSLKKFRKGRVNPTFVSDKKRSKNFYSFDICANSLGFITSRQFEATRRVLKRGLKKRAFLWLRVFPDIAKTKKPEKARMGKGKGRMHLWLFRALPGKVLFRVLGNSRKFVSTVFLKAKHKLPLKARIL